MNIEQFNLARKTRINKILRCLCFYLFTVKQKLLFSQILQRFKNNKLQVQTCHNNLNLRADRTV